MGEMEGNVEMMILKCSRIAFTVLRPSGQGRKMMAGGRAALRKDG